MTTQTTTTRLLLATVAGALAFLVAGVGGAAAAPAASQQPTNKCWLDVINDWADNNQVDKIYAIPCYTQAIQHLSAYPDIAGYSSAADDIHRAMLAVIHEEGRGAPPSAGGGSGPSGPVGPTGTSNPPGGGSTSLHEHRQPALARQRAVDPAPAPRARRPRHLAPARRRGDLVRPPDADPSGDPGDGAGATPLSGVPSDPPRTLPFPRKGTKSSSGYSSGGSHGKRRAEKDQ